MYLRPGLHILLEQAYFTLCEELKASTQLDTGKFRATSQGKEMTSSPRLA
jgi:hypothetical protein